jgi:F-type H+-transporting ATPase subunit epsilon
MGIYLDIVTPEKVVVSEEVEKIVCPGYDGELGILSGHIPFITSLKIGEINFIDSENKKDHYLIVTGGYLEVTGKKVTILADRCIRSRDFDKVQAELDLKKSDEVLKTAEKDSVEYLQAKEDYDYSRAILKLLEKIG